jgi:hypothetical protein
MLVDVDFKCAVPVSSRHRPKPFALPTSRQHAPHAARVHEAITIYSDRSTCNNGPRRLGPSVELSPFEVRTPVDCDLTSRGAKLN